MKASWNVYKQLSATLSLQREMPVSYTHLAVYKRQVKFSPVSYEALRFRAGKSGRSLAVYIREAALAATVTARHTPEENALLRSLAGMANNLNQLTKLSHQTGFYRTRLLIEGLLGKLKRIMDDYRPKGG